MEGFAAHFTINATFSCKVLSLKFVHSPIAFQNKNILCYFHLDRISDSVAIHCSSSHTLLAAEK